jgi:hypothetical protein
MPTTKPDDAFALHPEWRGYGMSYSEWRAEDREVSAGEIMKHSAHK